MSKERLEYIKQYYANQKVIVEIPAIESKTTKGIVINRFNGERAGIQFKDGFAKVDQKDLQRLKTAVPYLVIHREKEGE